MDWDFDFVAPTLGDLVTRVRDSDFEGMIGEDERRMVRPLRVVRLVESLVTERGV